MHYAVTGSRTWKRRLLIWRVLDNRYKKHGELYLWHGDCKRGADAIAHAWALDRIGRGWRVYLVPVPVNPEHDGPWPAAGNRRNGRMLAHYLVRCGMREGQVLAFHDGNSPGTADTIRRARKLGMRVKVWK